MATLVLGGAGFLIGSAIGGPAGAKIGAQIGVAVGGMIDSELARENATKMSDLKLSGSAYGVGIPRVWGRARVGGNVIWAAQDAKGNHLVQHKGGGKAGQSSSYTATFAVAVCVGETVFPDGSSDGRSATLKRIWADDLLIYDADDIALGHQKNYVCKLNSNLFFHSGTESQAVDSVILAKMGSSLTPAYRGLAYFVLQDFSLTKFGNRLPNFSIEVDMGSATYGDPIKHMCQLAGIDSSAIDVSAATDSVYGVVIGGSAAADNSIAGLLVSGNYDMPEVDGVLRVIPRGGSPSVTVSSNDIGASTNGRSDNPKYTRTRKMRWEMPGKFELSFMDKDRDYQQGVQSAIRQSENIANTISTSTPACMTATIARRIAYRELDREWIECETFAFTLPWRYLSVAPADVITFPSDTGSVRLRVTDVSFAAVGEIHVAAVLESAEVLTQVVAGDSGSTPATTVDAYFATTFSAWSGREIRDSDQQSAGFYVAAGGDNGWPGGTVYYSLNGGTSWIQGPAIGQSVFGVTAGTLSASGATANTFDNTNTVGIDVSLSFGSVGSVDDSAILAGRNHALIGSEILGVGTSSVTGTYTFTLSHLRRGERGTAMSGHASGDQFVLLGDNVVRVSLPDSTIGTTVLVKVINDKESLSDVTAQSITIAAKTPTSLSTLGISDAVLNAGGCPAIAQGLASAIPAPGLAGALYLETDTLKLKRDTGAAWVVVSGTTDREIRLLDGSVTPGSTGQYGPIVRVPAGPGGASVTWTIKAVRLRVEAPNANSSSINVKKSSGGAAFSGSNILTSALSLSGGSNYEASVTNPASMSITTLTTGELVQANIVSIGASVTGWSVEIDIEVSA